MAKSKRKRIVEKELPSRRLSRRLNNLQENGIPVRSSLRLKQSSEEKSSPTNNVAASITQSAKVASRSRKWNSSLSVYDIDYRMSKKQRNEVVSPSQLCSQIEHESISLSPVELNREFENVINAKGNAKKNISLFHNENDSLSESFDESINKSPIVDCEEIMSNIDSENDMDVTNIDSVETVENIPSKVGVNIKDKWRLATFPGEWLKH